VVYDGAHSVLIVGGAMEQMNGSGTEAAARGLTVWRVLSDAPYYKLLLDTDTDTVSLLIHPFRFLLTHNLVVNFDFITCVGIHMFITGPPTHSSNAHWRLSSSSVVICNTPWRACRQLHSRRPGNDVMPPAV